MSASPPDLPPSLRDTPPQTLFPEVYARDPQHRGWTRGGFSQAQTLLSALDPAAYGRDRSHLDGHVSRLSAFLRHGVVTLAQARDAALRLAPQGAPGRAYKFIDELSWRDFFVRVYARVGDTVWQDFQPYKTGLRAEDYAAQLPDDLRQGRTGAACVDSWARELEETGYLHNHVRMWLASYVVHHRRVRWQAGAAWFMTHLLDGDPAANNLNWQWVASTWRGSPYLWNRETMQKNAGDRFCAVCPLVQQGCPFAASYADLTERLFPARGAVPGGMVPGETGHLNPALLRDVPNAPPPAPTPAPDAVVWVHGDRLSPEHEALTAYPGRPAVFVWDDELLAQWTISAKRLSFLHDCVAELPVHVLRGPVPEEVARFARAYRARTVATTPSPSPRFGEIVRALEEQGFTVQVWPEPPLAAVDEPLDLRVHGAYWGQVKTAALGPAAPTPQPLVTVRPGGPPPERPRRRKKMDADPLF